VAAQDTPVAPSDTPKPPEAEPPPPPAEPSPPPEPPPEPQPAPPPAPTPKPPPPKRDVPAAAVTLEETPEEAPGAKPRGTKPPATKRRVGPRPEPEPAPEATTAPAAAPSAEPKPSETEPENGEAKKKKGEGDADESKSDKDDGNGLLGPFRIGIILGAGLPSIVSFGGMIKLTRYFGAGLNIGLIPSIKLSLYGDAQLSYQEYDLYGRLFPFGGSFFVGAGVGYASISGSFQGSYDITPLLNDPNFKPPPNVPKIPNPLPIGSEGSVRTLVLTPMIGLLHTFGSGFTIGIDLGAQVPIAPSETHFDPQLPPGIPPAIIDQYIKPNNDKVQDTLNTIGHAIVPTLNLRVGWLL
jgi:hypothetical protein